MLATGDTLGSRSWIAQHLREIKRGCRGGATLELVSLRENLSTSMQAIAQAELPLVAQP